MMKIRLITADEANTCNDFHNRIWKDRRTVEQWRWDFLPDQHGTAELPFAVADDDGRIVGTQAFIPIRMIDRDGVFWTAKSEETLVDPEYRGQKLFDTMYGLLFEYARRHHFAYIWGFTAATKAFLKLGFSTPGRTSQLFFPFSVKSVDRLVRSGGNGESTAKLALYRLGCALARIVSSTRLTFQRSMVAGKGAMKDVEIRSESGAPKGAGELCRRFVQVWGGTTIYRDADYLRWRIFDNPHVKGTMRTLYYRGQLLGWVIYGLGDDGVGYLIDLMAVPDDNKAIRVEDVVRLLLKESIVGTRNMGAVAIRGWHVNNHPFDAILLKSAKSIGFLHLARGHMVVLYHTEGAERQPPDDGFNDWFVTRIFTEGVLG